MGWQQGEDGGAGFGDVQPRYVFQVPLANRSLEEVHKNFNQLWRRNIKKAEKAGVEVVQGGYHDLEEWQRLYEITAVRDHFRPRPLSYFQRMWAALNNEDPNRMRLYFARHNGVNLSAATMLVVGGHVWYSYGASDNIGREVRPSNAMQWAMLRDAYALGATVYDLRGISDSLDESDHLFGLIQFQGRHGRAGGRIPRRVGLPTEQAAPQGARHLHVAPLTHSSPPTRTSDSHEKGPRSGHGAHPLRRHRALAGASQARAGAVPRARPGLQEATATASGTSGWRRRPHGWARTYWPSARRTRPPGSRTSSAVTCWS